MTAKQNGPDQTRLAIATLAACIVQALGERDESFRPRLEDALEKACVMLDESESDNFGAMETLRWTKDCLASL